MTDDHEQTADETDARARIAESLDRLLDKPTLNALLTEVLAINKSGRGWCGTCKKAVQVEIPDAKAVVSAMSELLTRAKGRPSAESGAPSEFVCNRYVIVQGAEPGDTVTLNGIELDAGFGSADHCEVQRSDRLSEGARLRERLPPRTVSLPRSGRESASGPRLSPGVCRDSRRLRHRLASPR